MLTIRNLLVCSCFVAGYFVCQFLLEQRQNSLYVPKLIFPLLTLDTNNEESKWILIRTIVLYLSVFLLLHSGLVMILRLFLGKSDPVTNSDPKIIQLLNKIIQNTLQQSIIFVCTFMYLIFEGPFEKLDPNRLLDIAACFVLGRVLFSLGYIVGSLIGLQQLRAIGFGLSLITNVYLVRFIFMSEKFMTHTFAR